MVRHPQGLWAGVLLAAVATLSSLNTCKSESPRWDIKTWLSDPGSPPTHYQATAQGKNGGHKQARKPLSSSSAFDGRLEHVESSLPSTRPRLMQWSDDMIEDNGGTILAISGRGYCVLAADTRLSAQYQIRSRNVTRIMEVSPRTAVGTAGGWADVIALRRELGYELGRYASLHGTMSTSALSTFLSNRLYLHRLKPLYALNVVAGLDSKGAGSVYTYDAVGSYNRVAAACCGRGQKLMQPVLDGLAGKDEAAVTHHFVSISCDEAVKVVKEAFLSGAEREISIGDEVEILVFRAGAKQPEVQRLALPRH